MLLPAGTGSVRRPRAGEGTFRRCRSAHLTGFRRPLLHPCRNSSGSALADYDHTCRQHDTEMDQIRAARMAEWGKIPVLETYCQMAIRQQKLHDYAQALWWAERGLAIYGEDTARPEAVADLRQRAAGYRAKLGI
jgi:hypothetical protein